MIEGIEQRIVERGRWGYILYEYSVFIQGSEFRFTSTISNPDEALKDARRRGITLWEYVEPWKRVFGLICLGLGIVGLIVFPIIVFAFGGTFGIEEASSVAGREMGLLVKGLIGSSLCIGTGLRFNKFFHRITLV